MVLKSCATNISICGTGNCSESRTCSQIYMYFWQKTKHTLILFRCVYLFIIIIIAFYQVVSMTTIRDITVIHMVCNPLPVSRL